jgi:hypothetical protein
MLLDRLPANEALAEEEEDPTRVLVGVDVTDMVTSLYPTRCASPGHLG